MIYVTHDQVEAMTLADKIVVLNAGRDRAGRRADGALQQPRQHLRRRLHRQPADELPRGAAPSAQPGKTLGIRPEHLALSRETGVIPGTISHVEHLGGETNVYVRTDQHGLLTVRRFGEHRFGVDETVHLTPDPARAFHFGDDGRRLAA